MVIDYDNYIFELQYNSPNEEGLESIYFETFRPMYLIS